MDFVVIAYLIILGLNIWRAPKLIATVEKNDCMANVETHHVISAIFIGLIPIINIVFLVSSYSTCKIIFDLNREYEGVEEDRKLFNREFAKIVEKHREDE